MKTLTVIFEEDKFFPRRFLFDQEIFPRIKLSQLDILPVIKARAADSFFIYFKTIGLDENKFKIESNTSAPDTPGISGNFRRK